MLHDLWFTSQCILTGIRLAIANEMLYFSCKSRLRRCKFQCKRRRGMSVERPLQGARSGENFNVSVEKAQDFNASVEKVSWAWNAPRETAKARFPLSMPFLCLHRLVFLRLLCTEICTTMDFFYACVETAHFSTLTLKNFMLAIMWRHQP